MDINRALYKHNYGQEITTDVDEVGVAREQIARFNVAAASAVAADDDGVLEAVTDDGTEQEITEGLSDPAVPRNITVTSGGTAVDIKAIQVTVEGKNVKGEAISEVMPAFTENTAGTVQGTKAFASVDKVTIPAHDGIGATTSVGWGDKLGIPYMLERNTVLKTYLGNVLEGTDPTVVVDSDEIEKNTIDLNSDLDGSDVDVYLMV